ncbi:ATP-binding protein [Patescibacteria group bacterium]|nr:ATP-binding protein [Patescibacteria group bacterium]MBU1885360.1 ATP-binding protein [Patescibacteria group bacterium]
MIKRCLQTQIIRAAKQFGVVSVTGPRQSGKTTLVKAVFPNHKYFNLEKLSDFQAIKADPLNFIDNIKNGVIIDEVQKFPELLSYIQVSIDENFRPGKFIITGSQNLLLSDKISQSLAGRVAVLTLFPLSMAEVSGVNLSIKNYKKLLLKGFYPSLYDKKIDINLFYSSYINTYVERDVRSIKNIGDLATFQRFLQLLAGRIGQLINLSQLGNDVGISYKTAESWISVLEASYVIKKLQPYYNNLGKRVTKSYKIYFVDVGLAAYLLGINSINELSNHFILGGLFENLIIMDLFKNKLNSFSSSKFFFFRDNHGNEVDLILDHGSKIVPIEIKAGATFSTDFLKGINFFNKINNSDGGYLIYSGNLESSINGTQLLNWLSLDKIRV